MFELQKAEQDQNCVDCVVQNRSPVRPLSPQLREFRWGLQFPRVFVYSNEGRYFNCTRTQGLDTFNKHRMICLKVKLFSNLFELFGP